MEKGHELLKELLHSTIQSIHTPITVICTDCVCRFVPVYRGSGGFGFTLSGNAPVFIRSVDPGGAAAVAGLKPGDRLLQLNGINIR